MCAATACLRGQWLQSAPFDGPWLAGLENELSLAGIDPGAWLWAAARVLPSVLLVPAFGLGALPVLARVAFAFILSASVAPALVSGAPLAALSLQGLLGQVLLGLPVALGAAGGLWAASIAGNLVDGLRGVQNLSPFAGVDAEATPFGVLLSLAASVAFLAMGGPARLVDALAGAEPLSKSTLLVVSLGLLEGLNVAVLLAGPLLALALVAELAYALVVRASQPAALHSLLAPLRSLVIVFFTALLLDRMVAALSLWLSERLAAS